MKTSYLGQDIPKLGFGLMRLPTLGPTSPSAAIDIEQVTAMTDRFMARGFTYFDTAYVYGNGNSEMAARDALVRRYPRDSFQLADKMPMGLAKTQADLRPLFETSLARTEAGYFDFYLLHALDQEKYKHSETIGAWDFLRQVKAEGLIRHAGFSFHDTPEVLEEILTARPEVEFVQLQINYADWENEDSRAQSRRCYEVARRLGKPIVIMEPIKGGFLADMNQEVMGLFKAVRPDDSAAAWALRYAASLDGLITVLSGMSNLEQMEDNLETMSSFVPFTDGDRLVIDQVMDILRNIPVIPCTDCRYCLDGCPQQINIPGVFRLVNDYKVYGNLTGSRNAYNWVTGGGGKASDCIECGACEQACPQHLEIIDLLKEAAAILE